MRYTTRQSAFRQPSAFPERKERKTNYIHDPTHATRESPCSLRQTVPASKTVDSDGHCIGEVQGNNRCGYNSVECTALSGDTPVDDRVTYLEDPIKIKPKRITVRAVKISAFNGSRRLGWTTARILDAGNPPSLSSLSIIMANPAGKHTWQRQRSCGCSSS